MGPRPLPTADGHFLLVFAEGPRGRLPGTKAGADKPLIHTANTEEVETSQRTRTHA